MFLHTIGYTTRDRMIAKKFQHSKENVSRQFNRVLKAICRVGTQIIQPPNMDATLPKIMRNPNYHQWFKVNVINFTTFFFLFIQLSTNMSWFNCHLVGLHWCYLELGIQTQNSPKLNRSRLVGLVFFFFGHSVCGSKPTLCFWFSDQSPYAKLREPGLEVCPSLISSGSFSCEDDAVCRKGSEFLGGE